MTDKQPSLDHERKDDHVRLALEQQAKMIGSTFDDIRFVHRSFNSVDFNQIDLSTRWAGHSHSLPFYINGMTGGTEMTRQYNDKLSQLAHATGLSMATGSMSIALKNPDVIDTFTIIRENNPDGFVLANLGAHHPVENAKKVVDILQANALQIHVNIPQEVVMPEGDRDFSSWLPNIKQMVKELDVPVIIKEVGFGMSRDTIEQLINIGVQTIDISGRGGTNFVNIENDRRTRLDFSLLGNFGQTTPESLIESLPYQDKVEILASGGIRNYMDIVKALSLGASATGLSGKFLAMVEQQGVEGATETVADWIESIQHTMLLLGAQDIKGLQDVSLILSNNLRQWAEDRQIDYKRLSNR